MVVGEPVFTLSKDLLTNCQQHVSVDGNFSQFKPLVSGVPLGSVLDPLLFILYTADFWNGLENTTILYADHTTLYVEVASPSDCNSACIIYVFI